MSEAAEEQREHARDEERRAEVRELRERCQAQERERSYDRGHEDGQRETWRAIARVASWGLAAGVVFGVVRVFTRR